MGHLNHRRLIMPLFWVTSIIEGLLCHCFGSPQSEKAYYAIVLGHLNHRRLIIPLFWVTLIIEGLLCHCFGSNSNSMLICTRQRIKKSTLNIFINVCTVKFTNTFNLLGVIIDNNLSWKDHIIHISKKLSSKIGLIKRLYHILPRSVLLKLYEPLFQSNLDYCITVWGHAANKYINLLQKLQNRLARVVTNNFNRDISHSDICRDLGWMSVRQRHNFLVGCLMHKVINISDLSHNYYNSCFTFIKDNVIMVLHYRYLRLNTLKTAFLLKGQKYGIAYLLILKVMTM